MRNPACLLFFFFLGLTINSLPAQFDAPVSVLEGQRRDLRTVVPADLDNDGLTDLLASDMDRRLYYYRNVGLDQLASAVVLADSVRPTEPVLVTDLNQDGAPDILFRAEEAGEILTWQLRNDPANPGQFTREPLLAGLPPRVPDLAADFNGDGAPDLIARRAPGSVIDTVFLYLNDGQGGFGPGLALPKADETFTNDDLRARDLDGDGDLDLFFTNGSLVGFLENPGDGQFTNQQIITDVAAGGYYLEPGDFDGDGRSDLLLARPGGSSDSWARAYLNRGEAGFERVDLYAEGGGNITWYPFLTGDFSGVGRDEILVRRNDTLTTFRYVAEATFVESSTGITDPEPNQNGLVVDWNNTGTLDLLLYDPRTVWRIPGLGDGTFAPAKLVNPEVASVSMAGHADLDQDGDQDVFFASALDSRIGWLPNAGEGDFGAARLISAGLRFPFRVYAADLDQDGLVDLVATDFDRLVTAFYNQGGGAFGPGVVLTTGRLITAPVDLDSDGLLDLIVQVASGDLVTWARQTGTGFELQSSPFFLPDLESGTFHFADLDSDGDKDAFVYASNALFTLRQNAEGLLDIGSDLLAEFVDYADLDLADFDGDGQADLIYSADPQGIVWHRNQGAFFGGDQVISDTESCPLEISVADFDNDGDPDIVGTTGTDTPCTDGYNAAFFENLGDSLFARTNYTVELSAPVTASFPVEIDGDGRTDLLTYHNGAIEWRKNVLAAPAVSGYCYWDQNGNGVRESTEPLLPDIGIALDDPNLVTFTDQNGYFRFYLGAGSYTATFETAGCWVLTSDSTSYTFTVGDNEPDFLTFGFQPTSSNQLLNAVLTTAPTRCNTLVPAWLTVRNDGCVPLAGEVVLSFDQLAGLVAAAIPPDSETGDTLRWTIDTLLAGETRTIELLLGIAGPEFLGDSVRISYQTRWADGTGTLVSGTAEQLVSELRCAYDPNDKLVDKTEIAPGYSPAEGTLRYTIRFQNTGNDTAFQVRLYDQLSPDLDWTSLRPLAASHPYDLELNRETGELEFFFRDILLPDSTTNEPASHGFVAFSVDLQPDLPLETRVSNGAEIYFDANPPIFTNEVETRIKEPVATDAVRAAAQLPLFPNPTDGELRIDLPAAAGTPLPVAVFDLFGRRIAQLTTADGRLDLGHLPAGVYLLRVQHANRTWVGRVIKE
jgi:uncharacterized repeat protein (TIGR01451 family)